MEKKNKILIVDDNSENLRVAANILKDNNNIIWLASSGKICLEIAKAKEPDLILMDVQMPEMDGFETCRKLKENKATSDIPVIFMTARTDDESIREGFECGAADYITKPIKNFEVMARVKTQLELIEHIKKLKETISVKDKFFSIIAHDLKGPIGALVALSDLVYEQFEDFTDTELKEIFSGTRDSSKKTLNLLLNLLEWAKSQTGAVKYMPETLNLYDAVNDNININKMVISKKNIYVENLCDRWIEIQADKEMLNTIIRNFLSNAVKFTYENGKIEFGTIEEETSIKFYIKDYGIGMNESVREKLFKISEKVSSIGTAGEAGSGIGLSICYEFIKKHGWEIEVESEIEKGTKFTLIIKK